MAIHLYKGILFDSQEEVWFAMWCEELKKVGLIDFWEKNAFSYELLPPFKIEYVKQTILKTKTKIENKEFTLLRELSYTPDFSIRFTRKGYNIFVSPMNENVKPDRWFFSEHPDYTILVEIKPSFDQHDKTAKFSILQKIFWHTKKEFVDLIIPENLFEGTFMPTEAAADFKYKKAPTGKNKGKKKAGDWKTDYIPKTLTEFLITLK